LEFRRVLFRSPHKRGLTLLSATSPLSSLEKKHQSHHPELPSEPHQFISRVPPSPRSQGSKTPLPLLTSPADLGQIFHGHLLTIKGDGFSVQHCHFRIDITLDHGFNIILIHNHPPEVTQGLSSSGVTFFRFFFLAGRETGRSEEHTSELQSRFD